MDFLKKIGNIILDKSKIIVVVVVLLATSIIIPIVINSKNEGNSNLSNNSQLSSSEISNESSIDPNLVQYKIEVLLDTGENVGAGVFVQLCVFAEEGGLCTSERTDESGVATFNLLPNVYKIDKVTYDGYALELGQKVDTENRNKTVILQKVINPSEGDGSQSNPFVIGEGIYNVTVENSQDVVYFGIKFSKSGSYSIESLSTGTLVDPKVESADEDLEADVYDPLKADVQYGNFKITLEIGEDDVNKMFMFAFSIANTTNTAKSYPISIKYLS